MGKIVLYYKYIDLEDPERIVIEQRQLCEELGLKGRILIAHEGINGTVGGPTDAVERYISYLKQHPLFFDCDIKESEGETDHFPRLKVIFKKEIVNFGPQAREAKTSDAGTYLSPEEAHALMELNPADLVVFDARNDYESYIGTFKGALTPHINHFRDLPAYIDNNLEQFKDKQVLMYCTGGIRCERATAYLNMKKVARKVYHVKGGIHRYIEAFPDGFFRGNNYVFDGRITQAVTNDILGQCTHCSIPYDEYNNCINAECNKQIIVCSDCINTYHNTCSELCKELVQAAKVNIRTIPHKILIRATG